MLSVILILTGIWFTGLVSGAAIVLMYQLAKESYKKYGTLFF